VAKSDDSRSSDRVDEAICRYFEMKNRDPSVDQEKFVAGLPPEVDRQALTDRLKFIDLLVEVRRCGTEQSRKPARVVPRRHM
jgi:hypothetical protein